MWGVYGIYRVLYLVFFFGMLGLGLYCVFLCIKIAKRVIKALDIYIENNKKTE